MASGKAGNAIGKLCNGRATKIVWVDSSTEPLVAHWDGEMANKSWKRNMCRHVKAQNLKSELAKMQCLFV